MPRHVLFPASYLNARAVDEHFQDQYAVASVEGRVALFEQDGDFTAFRGLKDAENVVYRGWMLGVEEYAALEASLQKRGIHLLTSATSYEKAHHLPGWYKVFQHLTPKSIWVSTDESTEELVRQARTLHSESFIVKDYVKSRKDQWDTACFAESIDTLPKIVEQFKELQGEFLTGGVVVRAYEDFDKSVNEARVWWVSGEVADITAHPDTPGGHVAVPEAYLQEVQKAVKDLNCPFVTTDITRDTSGSFRVIEVGDGQVSDFPARADFTKLVSALV